MASPIAPFVRFKKLAPCEEHVKVHPELSIYSEDLNASMAKRFIATTPLAIFEQSQFRSTHFYENYSADQPLKLFVDLDMKLANQDQCQSFNSSLNDLIDLIAVHLTHHNIINPSTIILTSHRADKLSAHLIWPTIIFANVHQMKHFITELQSPLVTNQTVDLGVYKKGSLRMLWNCKYGVNVPLEFTQGHNYNPVSNQQLFMDCLLTQIHSSPTTHHITLNIPQPSPPQIKPSGPIIEFPELSKYVHLLSQVRCDNYMKWIRVGMALKSCNPDAFDLWDQWSQLSPSYSSRQSNLNLWSTFKPGYVTIGSLRYWAQQDNPEAFAQL